MATPATAQSGPHPGVRVQDGTVPLPEFGLEHGGRVVDGSMAYRLLGIPGNPVIAVLGGISADRVIAAQEGDQGRGWWEWMVGVGNPLDLRTHQVLAIDYLFGRGDSRGSVVDATPPASVDPVPVPLVTPTDQARTLAAVVEGLELAPLCGLVGASYGGAVALSFAATHPDLTLRTLVIGAADRSHPMATAVRVVERRIVQRAVAVGNESTGVALARALAMTTYRSDREFAQRFAGPPALGPDGVKFPVESYIDHHGQTFARRFTPAQFLTLSQSSDLHWVDAEHVRTPVTLVSTDPDFLAPRWQMADLARRMGEPHRLIEVSSLHGHDAFLTDQETFAGIVRDFVGSCESAGARSL